MFLGIDYGNKKAGTTAICYNVYGTLMIEQSEKNKDADAFLFSRIKELNPELIFIDAPLTIPLAYFNKGTDFFYRKCDRDAQAMSPMFLGGLTARAMKLHQQLNEINFYMNEGYPGYVARNILELKELYKNSINSFTERLHDYLPLKMKIEPESWHQVDSVLAWLVAFRFSENKAQVFGDKKEGLIYA